MDVEIITAAAPNLMAICGERYFAHIIPVNAFDLALKPSSLRTEGSSSGDYFTKHIFKADRNFFVEVNAHSYFYIARK